MLCWIFLYWQCAKIASGGSTHLLSWYPGLILLCPSCLLLLRLLSGLDAYWHAGQPTGQCAVCSLSPQRQLEVCARCWRLSKSGEFVSALSVLYDDAVANQLLNHACPCLASSYL